MIAILLVLVGAASAATVTPIAEDPVEAVCRLFPAERREGIRGLVDCVYGANITAKHVVYHIFLHKHKPPFISLVETAESDEWRRCLIQANDSLLVAVGNVGGEFARLALDGKTPVTREDAGYEPADVLDVYHEICNTTPSFSLPCLWEEGTVSGINENALRRHYRLLEFYGAFSFLGEQFNPGRFCSFDLADKLNPTVYTDGWKAGDPIITKCFESDAKNLVFLVNAVML
ncbi:unnamed protein product [Bursaphelenchus xylophilus]|uniref:(pine wood nematode) hypothetical protein n=1 Tax=Bursaphelenchus xylophilus TaxID=6326 RepID=A0A1I7S6V5_BURXY|nr:unnamed protein product [Bursaphelenchus xylophilus]CAG9079719.1 unnamed protein product [Bursaphelenchus xylophilus]